MGRGDKRSRKGKISVGSYGKTRPKRKKKAATTQSATESAPKKATRKKKTE